MNSERLSLVADAIERGSTDLGFDMTVFRHVTSCGTVACIAGWAGTLFARDGRGNFYQARLALGLTEDEADQLFFASNHPRPDVPGELGPLQKITSTQAVAVLRHAAATGVIDWSVADE